MKVLIILMALQFIMVDTGLCEGQNALNNQDMQLFEELKTDHNLDDAQTYQLMGMAFLKNDFFEKASACFEKAVELNNNLYLSWYHLGLINMDNPELYFKKAIDANPQFPLSHYWLGMYYKHNERKPETIECFKKYLEVVDRNDSNEEARIVVAEQEIKEGL